MPTRIIRDEQDRRMWCRYLEAQPLPMTVSYAKGARRSNQQNRLAHDWYSQIAAETGQSAAEAKAECKLRFGLPILARDNAAWVAKWEPLYRPLTYALRLRLFEAIPVTSVMTVRQKTEYMDAVQKEYRAQGIMLTDPEAMRIEQMYGDETR